MLLPLLERWEEEEHEELVADIGSIADGGMALTAYGKLQYVDMVDLERA